MTDGYAERRRQYVDEIRNSFETDTSMPKEEWNGGLSSSYGIFFKIRLILALAVFAVFLYCNYMDIKIGDYSTEKIIEMVSDNHYYTKLQNYVMIQEQNLSSEKGLTE